MQTVEEVVEALGCLLIGMATDRQASDAAFQEARLRYLQFVLSYQADQPRLAAAFGSWFEEPTLELLINRSCRDLLTHLGLMEIAARQGRPLPPPLLIDWTRPPADLSLK